MVTRVLLGWSSIIVQSHDCTKTMYVQLYMLLYLSCLALSAIVIVMQSIIGASLSELHTSELELWTVVGWLVGWLVTLSLVRIPYILIITYKSILTW